MSDIDKSAPASLPSADDLEACLAPTYFLDWEAPPVRDYAERHATGATTAIDRAVAVFYAVRDGIQYDPYTFGRTREGFRASEIVRASRSFCIPKAILLAACARALEIPARLGFADVRNHLATPRLLEMMGTDLFAFHGYTELFLEGTWVKATPAFNRQLCERFGVRPLEFDGRTDALFHQFTADGRKHMEYVRERGTFSDFPFDYMTETMREVYGSISIDAPGSDPGFGDATPK